MIAMTARTWERLPRPARVAIAVLLVAGVGFCLGETLHDAAAWWFSWHLSPVAGALAGTALAAPIMWLMYATKRVVVSPCVPVGGAMCGAASAVSRGRNDTDGDVQ